jgi:hypothetical protein
MERTLPRSRAEIYEVPIANLMWRWSFLDIAQRRDMAEIFDQNQNSIHGTVEFYLCQILLAVPLAQRHNLWCDGVERLAIERPSRTSFKLSGIAWAPDDFMPFELEFQFKNRRDVTPVRKVLRFGDIDANGEIRRHSPNGKSIDKMFQKRLWVWAINFEYH